jgi:hypothetical protein
MSSSKSKVSVSIEGHQGLVQVLDSHLQERTSGVGGIQTDLEPGIYKVRASLSESISEHYFEVKPDSEDVEISIPALQLKSAVPTLSNTPRQKAQQKRLEDAIRHPTLDPGIGGGAGLMLCSRFHASIEPGVLPTFRLRTPEGELVVDLSLRAESRHDAEGIQALSIMLKPGHYRMCHEPEFGASSAIAVEAVSGWRLEFFFRVDAPSKKGAEGVPDLVDYFVSMARVESKASKSLSESRASEVARRSLAIKKNLLTSSEMSILLYGKFSDPIFGLLVAHVELLSERPDVELLKAITRNVARMLGQDHSDVIALRCALYVLDPASVPKKPKLERVSAPLLAGSWVHLKNAAKDLGDEYRYELSEPKGGSVWYVWKPYSVQGLVADVLEATEQAKGEIKKQLRKRGITVERIETVISEQKVQLGEVVLGAITSVDWNKVGTLVATQSGKSTEGLTDAQLSLLPALQLVSSEIERGRSVDVEGLNTVRKQLKVSWKGLGRAVSDLGSLLDKK